MEDFIQQKENLFQLIESWEKENIELALQITKGNSFLLEAAQKRYLPLIKMVGGCELKEIIDFPKNIAHISLTKNNIIPYNEDLVSLFNNLPCRGIYCYYNNGVKELPWWLFEIQQLTFLDLSGRGIKKIPKAIGKLKNLNVLRANRNGFEQISAAIGDLIELKKIQLDFNKIKEIPDTIGNLTKLEWLCLESTKIQKLPSSIQNLKNITWLSIEKTPLGDRLAINRGIYLSQGDPLFQKLIAGK